MGKPSYKIISKKCYDSVISWNKKKNFKNFCMVYKYSFRFKYLWQRPFWRVWRIIRNTWILKEKYLQFELVDRSEFKD